MPVIAIFLAPRLDFRRRRSACTAKRFAAQIYSRIWTKFWFMNSSNYLNSHIAHFRFNIEQFRVDGIHCVVGENSWLKSLCCYATVRRPRRMWLKLIRNWYSRRLLLLKAFNSASSSSTFCMHTKTEFVTEQHERLLFIFKYVIHFGMRRCLRKCSLFASLFLFLHVIQVILNNI